MISLISDVTQVNGLAIAYPVTAQDGKTSTLQFVGFSLGTKTPSGLCGKWCRYKICWKELITIVEQMVNFKGPLKLVLLNIFGENKV